MIKKIVVFLSFFLFLAGSTFAQELSPTSTPTPTPTFIKYDLAFPGMLPDHPLYKLKVLRDKVMLTFTRDPMKKAQYHLLLADKRIHMAAILADKGKVELAKETALKGENEYTLLVFLFKDEVKKPDKKLFDKLEKAGLKHQEVLRSIVNKVDKKDEKTFVTVIEFSERNLEELRQIYKNY
ncbi:MAG: hypothetical protein US51_C0020G0017 [Microgenomates group bacterium GW2011_GWA2_37_6]|nr:MAG: hypothetical protein US51_C0020G0017 [Microgenomates group bacterium GW2011_GWA2_37_6]